MKQPIVYCGCGYVMDSKTSYSDGGMHSMTATCSGCGFHVDVDFDNTYELPTRLEGSD